MNDTILGFLREARAAALDDSAKSRELSLVVTKIDEAILWRQFDLQIKAPPVNESPPLPRGSEAGAIEG